MVRNNFPTPPLQDPSNDHKKQTATTGWNDDIMQPAGILTQGYADQDLHGL
jgi:hypothetical protein